MNKKLKNDSNIDQTANQNNATVNRLGKKDFEKIVLKSSFFASIFILCNSVPCLAAMVKSPGIKENLEKEVLSNGKQFRTLFTVKKGIGTNVPKFEKLYQAEVSSLINFLILNKTNLLKKELNFQDVISKEMAPKFNLNLNEQKFATFSKKILKPHNSSIMPPVENFTKIFFTKWNRLFSFFSSRTKKGSAFLTHLFDKGVSGILNNYVELGLIPNLFLGREPQFKYNYRLRAIMYAKKFVAFWVDNPAFLIMIIVLVINHKKIMELLKKSKTVQEFDGFVRPIFNKVLSNFK